MHKNIPVVDMKIDDETHTTIKLCNNYDVRHLPPGVNICETDIDLGALHKWYMARTFPANRQGVWWAFETLGVTSPHYLINKCYGLSLSDQYWIRPKNSNLKWSEVNFFHNNFSKDMGEILFEHQPFNSADINIMSPDIMTNGWLRKRWVIADGKRFLMKGGSGVYKQEPFSEVIASAVMRRLNILHVDYKLTFENGNPYSLCENFITPDTEFIPAWCILITQKKPNNRSLRNHFFDCCDTLDIPNVKSAVDKMLILDYIISNEDRHWNNFGFLRNAETLEWFGLAPVFDSGTSLWHNTSRIGTDMKCKPFHRSHAEQIELIEDFSCFDSNALNGLDSEIKKILSQSEDIDENRSNLIAAAVMEHCEEIDRLTKR